MGTLKSKAIERIEERMQAVDPASLRYHVLESARNFKSSWIDLGRDLFTVYKDKRYREWGYLTFEAYCAKEIGIRQTTAVKILKSYSFLESEEPHLLRRESSGEAPPNRIPGYEAVNALRLAKQSERIPEEDYRTLRSQVFDEAKEDTEVKQKIRYLLKSRAPAREQDPLKKKREVLSRLTHELRSARAEARACSLSAKLVRKIDELLELLSSEFSASQ